MSMTMLTLLNPGGLTGFARRHALPLAKRSSIGQADFMSKIFNE